MEKNAATPGAETAINLMMQAGMSRPDAENILDKARITAEQATRQNPSDDVTVDVEFIQDMQKAAQVILESAARIRNTLRDINRNFAYADDKIIKDAAFALEDISGDLCETWDSLTNQFICWDLNGIGGAA